MATDLTGLPTLDDVRAAAARIAPFVHRTPLMSRASLSESLGCEVVFKCENLQRVGAFKARGACNAVFALDGPEAGRGVATHSSGNHGAALALAAARRGIPAWVVVPDNAPRCKRESVARYGATVVSCRPGLANREARLAEVVAETGARVVHPYDDDLVIAGQGTAALEMLEERPDLDVILAPVGGGGLLSGTAIVARGLGETTRVIGVEPARADDTYRSFKQGKRVGNDAPDTVADGLRASVGVRNFRAIRALVDDIVTVEEQEFVAAMWLLLERLKLLVEPSAGVPLAALTAGRLDLRGQRVGVILTGGNVDMEALPGLLELAEEPPSPVPVVT